MAITFFGVATTPADNSGSSLGPTVTITPPASMQDGDLVFVSVRYRASSTTLSVSNDGGQVWSNPGQYNTTNIRAAGFWCRFNGTWSANPSFTVTSGGNNIDAQMLVFRPTSATYTWALESGPNSATYSAPSTPFTVTVTGRTTTAASTVSIACWHSVDDNTWGTLSGTGWSKTSLGAQYRNNDTADNSSTFAYNIKTSAGATNDVSQNQATLGGDAGSTALFTFSETLITALPSGIATGSAAAGVLGISNTEEGLLGVGATASAGVATGPSSATNATGSPVGVTGSSFIGTAAPIASSTRAPTGVAGTGSAGAAVVNGSIGATPTGVSGSSAVGAVTVLGPVSANATPSGAAGTSAAGSPAVNVKGSPVGVAASAGVGAAVAQVSGSTSANTQPVGTSVTGQAGSLGGATTIAGIAGVQASAAAGTASVPGTVNAAGQPPGRSITATAGDIAAAGGLLAVGVSATAVAESLGSSTAIPEIDGSSVSGAVGAVTDHTSAFVPSVASSTAIGNVSTIRSSVVTPFGAQSVAAQGSASGITATQNSAVPGGIAALASAGDMAPVWTSSYAVDGVEAGADAGNAAVQGGDTSPSETFPAGVVAAASAGIISVGETTVGIIGVEGTASAGTLRGVKHDITPPHGHHGRIVHGREPHRRVHGQPPRRKA